MNKSQQRHSLSESDLIRMEEFSSLLLGYPQSNPIQDFFSEIQGLDFEQEEDEANDFDTLLALLLSTIHTATHSHNHNKRSTKKKLIYLIQEYNYFLKIIKFQVNLISQMYTFIKFNEICDNYIETQTDTDIEIEEIIHENIELKKQVEILYLEINDLVKLIENEIIMREPVEEELKKLKNCVRIALQQEINAKTTNFGNQSTVLMNSKNIYKFGKELEINDHFEYETMHLEENKKFKPMEKSKIENNNNKKKKSKKLKSSQQKILDKNNFSFFVDQLKQLQNSSNN
ncbi:hypothetical protein M0813_20423 [Anaeramoeba flamelloides]|uniref:Uncharacterized protein n=1 Tax=Anaeramoeba flamelloides TaxID=1746091 RepID=A0ABQ8YLD2_9EUKA|nr:hypothetical protein M0813_20423 [Anaeramoeba flamelloides]